MHVREAAHVDAGAHLLPPLVVPVDTSGRGRVKNPITREGGSHQMMVHGRDEHSRRDVLVPHVLPWLHDGEPQLQRAICGSDLGWYNTTRDPVLLLQNTPI